MNCGYIYSPEVNHCYSVANFGTWIKVTEKLKYGVIAERIDRLPSVYIKNQNISINPELYLKNGVFSNSTFTEIDCEAYAKSKK